ncbi:protein-tyrosine phosphatase-like protein [Absidia repens]|uniref:Protein-tyrosine phosphatase-like protein n=1 Tax=Absidia repens TaxID=90262 RepID=A0A1X2IA33_9FUNG|nr:protein-tyrosine phosphatase-like protein [Absidia repens]
MTMATEQQRQQHIMHHYKVLTDRQARRLEHSQNAASHDNPFSQSIAHSHDQHNRYCDIIPYNATRVTLTQSDLGPTGTTAGYINASWVSFDQRKRYIAAQGPLPSTCGDFWRMVLEHGVKMIVCLTPEVENGRNKCAAYWPRSMDQEARFTLTSEQDDDEDDDDDQDDPRGGGGARRRRSFGHHLLYNKNGSHHTSTGRPTWTMQVKYTQPEYMDQDAACIIRPLEVSCYRHDHGGSSQKMASATVHQLHFLGWADHGVPQQTHSLNALVQLTNRLQPQPSDSELPPPMVVHCSAGCGRTGTFCVVDTGLTWLGEMKQGNNKSNNNNGNQRMATMDPIYQMTDTFRQQRTTMVQTPAQYLFCYRAIWDQLQRLD